MRGCLCKINRKQHDMSNISSLVAETKKIHPHDQEIHFLYISHAVPSSAFGTERKLTNSDN